MIYDVSLRERFLTYPVDEYRRWKDACADTIGELLSVCGSMGRTQSTYANQAARGINYFEAKFGCHLVQYEGMRQDELVYENYVLATTPPKPISMKAYGTGLVREVFSNKFFERFEELHAKNGVSRQVAKIHVDLFAANPRTRRCGFWEMKSYNPDDTATEKVDTAQTFLLAAVRYLCDKQAEEVLRDPSWSVATEIVVYEPQTFRALDHAYRLEV